MLHGDPSPTKKPAYPPFPRTGNLGTLRKLTQIARDFIGTRGLAGRPQDVPNRNLPKLLGTSLGLGDLLAVPKTFPTDFRDVMNRFQGCSRQISGIFLGRFWGYSGHISSVLTIMEIDDWTIRSFFPSIIFVLH
jgi:hypothetical protein